MKPLDPLPSRLLALPRDERGYPVPWFVAWVDAEGKLVATGGAPDFRVMSGEKFALAVKQRLCWVCGQPLGQWLAFGIGPMCAITRTISEPPSHRECMIWSIKNCPFLANPAMGRDLRDVPKDAEDMAGLPLLRNPGVMCLWITRSYELFRVPGKQKQPLITIGHPEHVSWWREGRPATLAEVEASINSGMPALLGAAKVDGPFAVEMLGKQYEAARYYFPVEEAVP